MRPVNIVQARLANQLLAGTKRRHPGEVVSWLGAVQAQDFAAAKWAVGLRTYGAADADVEAAFNEGAILRTHVMRPTWHFVAPEDLRSLLALTAPRVHQANARRYRTYLTRADLAGRLREHHIEASGQKLAYILMHAELEGLICSGPRRGKQLTHRRDGTGCSVG